MIGDKKIGFIGVGNMGEALIRGLLRKRVVPARSIIAYDIEKGRMAQLKKRYGIKTSAANVSLVKECGIIILAVKPIDIGSLLEEVRGTVSGKLLISIAAGITTKYIEKALRGKASPVGNRISDGARVIRVMPNTPALVGEGASVIVRGRFASGADEKTACEIFGSVGMVVKMKDENKMDAVTALSGSGPAYFFYLMEALIKAGTKLKLGEEETNQLVHQTALGSAKLLIETKLSPQVLRERVTSKGGTTEAAIKVFRKRHLDEIIEKAVMAAAKRSREFDPHTNYPNAGS